METGMPVSSYTEVVQYLCWDLWFNHGGRNIKIHLAVMFRITVEIIFIIAMNEI